MRPPWYGRWCGFMTTGGSSKPSTRQPISSLIEASIGPRTLLHPAGLEPRLGLGEERARDLGVVDGVEEAEEAGVVLVALEVLAVDLRGDAADALAVLVRDEDGALGVLEERVLLRVEPILQVHVERADVVRVVPVDAVDDVRGSRRGRRPIGRLPDLHHERTPVVPFARASVNAE